jgi:hypothetical protein
MQLLFQTSIKLQEIVGGGNATATSPAAPGFITRSLIDYHNSGK